MMTFIDELEKVIDQTYNVSVTENGAVGYKTTGKYLLDANFKVASYRHMDESDIITDWNKAFKENALLALKWLFYVRDVRGGLGERRTFRIIIKNLVKTYPGVVKALLPLMSEYGRWDDVLELLHTSVEEDVIKLISTTLHDDIANFRAGKSVSLLAKWLPSENTSSSETKQKAKYLISRLHVTPREYRKVLSGLRKYIDIVEGKMSANAWDKIDYEAVPSKANLIYSDAFLRRDEERRKAFLDKVSKGNAKINASVLFPHEIVHKYTANRYSLYGVRKDEAIEALWKALPDFGIENTITVADGSGSMESRVSSDSSVTALDVANALAIYTAQHCRGAFKNTYITFSRTPQIVHLNSDTLLGNIKTALDHNECANTDIEAVFKLILKTAVQNGMAQEDLPKNILIISDMEFDAATSSYYSYYGSRSTRVNQSLFDTIAKQYELHGYKMPKLIFWNVSSRTCTIPVTENELGVALVSGFSVNIMKMVMSNKLDPYEILCETLNSERYEPIVKALLKQ